MIKREAASSLIVRHWLRAHPYHTCSIEMKDTRGKNYLNFSEVKEAQLDYGMAIESDRGVLMRVEAVSEGMPDYIYMRNEDAMVAIKYPDFISLITIPNFIGEKEKSEHKSLTSSRAKEIATDIIKFKKNV